MGGSRTKKKVVGENDSTLESSSLGNSFMTAPTKPPWNKEFHESAYFGHCAFKLKSLLAWSIGS